MFVQVILTIYFLVPYFPPEHTHSQVTQKHPQQFLYGRKGLFSLKRGQKYKLSSEWRGPYANLTSASCQPAKLAD